MSLLPSSEPYYGISTGIAHVRDALTITLLLKALLGGSTGAPQV